MLSRNFPKLKAWMGLGYSFLSRFIFTFICVHGCVSVYGCMQLSPVLTESGKECWVPGARVTSGWELPRECLDCTCVPCKSSKPSKTLSCLLSLLFSYIAFGTLTNVVVDKCEDKFFFFFFLSEEVTSADPAKGVGMQSSADRQKAEPCGQVPRFSLTF
jgi:hypothetical protein